MNSPLLQALSLVHLLLSQSKHRSLKTNQNGREKGKTTVTNLEIGLGLRNDSANKGPCYQT